VAGVALPLLGEKRALALMLFLVMRTKATMSSQTQISATISETIAVALKD